MFLLVTVQYTYQNGQNITFLKTYLQTGSLHKTPPYPSLQTQVLGVFPQCPLTHPFMGMHSVQFLPTHPEKQLELEKRLKFVLNHRGYIFHCFRELGRLLFLK